MGYDLQMASDRLRETLPIQGFTGFVEPELPARKQNDYQPFNTKPQARANQKRIVAILCLRIGLLAVCPILAWHQIVALGSVVLRMIDLRMHRSREAQQRGQINHPETKHVGTTALRGLYLSPAIQNGSLYSDTRLQ